MIKIAFFDIDGTLFSHKTGSVPISAINAIQQLKAHNIKIVIATGRHYSFIETLQLNELLQPDGYITLNGQYTFTSEGEVVYDQPLSKRDRAHTLQYLSKIPFSCVFMEGRQLYTNLINERLIEQSERYQTPLPEVRPVDELWQQPVYQLNPIIDNESAFIQGLHDVTITHWGPKTMDVIYKTGGKHQGIRHLLAHYHVTKEEAIAFGDGENDMTMFEEVGISVAMGNAVTPLKAIASYVTTDIDDDGIYVGLQHVGLVK